MTSIDTTSTLSRPTRDGTPSRSTGRSPARLHGVVRVGVVVSVVTAAVIALFGFAYSISLFDARADRHSSEQYLDRIYGWEPDTPRVASYRRMVEFARATMPEGDSYRVVVAPDWQPLWNLENGETLDVDFLRYFLLPRREAEAAKWVFCFGCDPAAVRPALTTLVDAGHGFRFGRLES